MHHRLMYPSILSVFKRRTFCIDRGTERRFCWKFLRAVQPCLLVLLNRLLRWVEEKRGYRSGSYGTDCVNVEWTTTICTVCLHPADFGGEYFLHAVVCFFILVGALLYFAHFCPVTSFRIIVVAVFFQFYFILLLLRSVDRSPKTSAFPLCH